jgi:hypothetical protein
MTEPRFISATYHANLQVAEFICEDGRHLLRSGGKLPWRINNCGDLKAPMVGDQPAPKKTKNFIGYAKIPDKEQASLVHHFFIFPDYATGREQLELSLNRRYAEMTLPQMVKVYAPSSENDTGKYLKDLQRLSGLPDDLKIGAMDKAQFKSLVDAIERIEGYHNNASDRKEVWVAVSHINATDGARPLADEEIVLRAKGEDTVLKSNDVGQFRPVPHSAEPIEVLHRTADNELKPVGTIGGDTGRQLSLVTRVQRFSGMSGPETPPTDATSRRHRFAYQVEPNDTLGGIAKRFGTTVEQIKQDNRRTNDRVFAGEILGIYGPPPVDAIAAKQPKRSPPKPAAPAKAAATASASASLPAATPAPKAAPPAAQVAKAARSDTGAGKPLAIINPEPGRAPWMPYAIAEAKKFKGVDEKMIVKSRNYAVEAHTGQDTIVEETNNSHAWCAAFVDWCLMKAGYPVENTGFEDAVAEKGRAHYFFRTKAKREILSQEEVVQKNPKTGKEEKVKKTIYAATKYIPNPLYRQIEKPIYGCIAVVADRSDHGHHTGFVYARHDNNRIVLLGGNQGDTIRFSPFSTEHKQHKKTRRDKAGKETTITAWTDKLLYFVPAAYANHAKEDLEKDDLPTINSTRLNKDFGISEDSDAADTQ